MIAPDLLNGFTAFPYADLFRTTARHSNYPNAFTQQRKLQLLALIIAMLCRM